MQHTQNHATTAIRYGNKGAGMMQCPAGELAVRNAVTRKDKVQDFQCNFKM